MSFGDLKLHGHFDSFFYLGVNQSGPRTSSTTDHKFYRALGQLHGPWCKQPLSVRSLLQKNVAIYHSNTHSKLYNIMLVATKVHITLRSLVVLNVCVIKEDRCSM